MKDVCLAYLPEIAVGDYTIVVTGFEPLDLLEGIRRTVRQLEEGRDARRGAASSDMLSESSMTLVSQPAWRLDERATGIGARMASLDDPAAAIPFAPPRSLVWPVEAACWLRHHNESNQ